MSDSASSRATPFHDLDAAACANLSDASRLAYWRYKQRLIAEGLADGEIEEILTGFIWDEIEEPV